MQLNLSDEETVALARVLTNAIDAYGAATKDARAMLQRSVATAIAQFWLADGDRPATIDQRASSVEAVVDDIQTLTPQSEAQRLMQSQALTMATITQRRGVSLNIRPVSVVPANSYADHTFEYLDDG
jgi:hypothetical protein